MKVNENEILLIDGNSLFFKAFYATYKPFSPNDNNDKVNHFDRSFKTNEPIGAIRTFSYMILNLIQKFNSEYILVAFDKGSKTFRHKYDFYKQNRKKQPEELYQQLREVKKFLKLMGIKIYEDDNLEADDIIGILATKAKEKNMNINIITTDRDLLQLVNENVNLYLSKNGISKMELYNLENFYDSWNIYPEQVPDLKALMGDNSDNIKGILGIGPKTALKLIDDYQSIENLIESIDSLNEKIRQKILNQKEDLLIFKNLTKIITKYEIELSLEELKYQLIDLNQKKKVIRFLNEKSIFNVANKIEREL